MKPVKKKKIRGGRGTLLWAQFPAPQERDTSGSSLLQRSLGKAVVSAGSSGECTSSLCHKEVEKVRNKSQSQR